jgi:sugar (pentulose or hexulose) kinase
MPLKSGLRWLDNRRQKILDEKSKRHEKAKNLNQSVQRQALYGFSLTESAIIVVLRQKNPLPFSVN